MTELLPGLVIGLLVIVGAAIIAASTVKALRQAVRASWRRLAQPTTTRSTRTPARHR